MKKIPLVPITKVISIINSCTSIDQLEGCKRLAAAYTLMVKSKGVINYNLVIETLITKLQEKQEEIEMSENFYAR